MSSNTPGNTGWGLSLSGSQLYTCPSSSVWKEQLSSKQSVGDSNSSSGASEHSVVVTQDPSKFLSRVQISAARSHYYYFMDITPPFGLTSSGLKLWEKETKKGRLPFLYSVHFVSWDAYGVYREELELAPYKSDLLDGVENPDSIDPRFLRNLCKVLSRIDEQLSEKADRSDPDY